jgi:hypothetical protein
MSLIYASAQQQFVYNVSGGAVVDPLYGSWLAAYAVYLGATEPNGTWLETICLQLGVTQPVNGSWVQALANYYGITDTIGYGNWWLALADASGPAPGNEIWGTSLAVWATETDTWALV